MDENDQIKCKNCNEYYGMTHTDNLCSICYHISKHGSNSITITEDKIYSYFQEWALNNTYNKTPELMTREDHIIFECWLCEEPRSSFEIYNYLSYNNHKDTQLFINAKYANQWVKALRDYNETNISLPTRYNGRLYGTIPNNIKYKYEIVHAIYPKVYNIWDMTEDVNNIGNCYYFTYNIKPKYKKDFEQLWDRYNNPFSIQNISLF